MKSETILLISTQKTIGNSVLAAIKATGYRVVCTSSSQAMALLFIMHCAAVVVLDRAAGEKTTFEGLARQLRAMCHDVPIILLSPTPISPLPSQIDAYVSTAPPLASLTSAVLRALASIGGRHQPDSLAQASRPLLILASPLRNRPAMRNVEIWT